MFQAQAPEAAPLFADPGTDDRIHPTDVLTGHLDLDHHAENTEASEVEAQWALWGKDGGETDYRVLRHGKGPFGPDDFQEIITRYASGGKESLPQYTVYWIPAEAHHDGYLAVGIHELADADPRRSGGRARTAGGREIEYIRLFCVRYAELAASGVTYSDLVDAVRGQQLPADLAGPVKVDLDLREIAPRPDPPPAERLRLAENVATLLLTTRPVCVLGAEGVTAEDRLAFIDSVMSLLPYGLRTTMSASTWASSTMQGLKLRLFFSNAERDDGGRTSYVTWDQPGELVFSAGDGQVPRLYLSWLRQHRSGAEAALIGETSPVRFHPAEIRKMVASLPEDRPVRDTLKGLADSLSYRDQPAVSAEVQRLRRYLAHAQDPADRQEYRRLIADLGLLQDYDWLQPSRKSSVYRVLLDLAFEAKLSYAGYCEIEDAIGHPPQGVALRTELLKRIGTFVPWVLVLKADIALPDETLVARLAEQRMSAATPISVLQRDIKEIRPEHRSAPYRVAVQSLRSNAEEPRAELVRLGYLADMLETVFPGDRQSNRQAQRANLEQTLHFVYGEQLTRGRIAELFGDPKLYPTKALEVAVAHLASRKDGPFIAERAAYARLRYMGHGDDARIIQRGMPERSGWRMPHRSRWRIPHRSRSRNPNVSRRRKPSTVDQDLGTVWLIPKATAYSFAVFLTVLAMLVFVWFIWHTS
jgi:hypothetical protein